MSKEMTTIRTDKNGMLVGEKIDYDRDFNAMIMKETGLVVLPEEQYLKLKEYDVPEGSMICVIHNDSEKKEVKRITIDVEALAKDWNYQNVMPISFIDDYITSISTGLRDGCAQTLQNLLDEWKEEKENYL